MDTNGVVWPLKYPPSLDNATSGFGGEKAVSRGAWVAQLVKHSTLDSGSGHDLTVCGLEPHVGLCADSTEPASDPPFLSLSAPLVLSLSQK